MASMMDNPDWTEAAEARLLEAAIRLAPQEGWTARMVRLAGQAAGYSEGETELLAPQGPADLAALFSRRHDARARLMLKDVDPQTLKVRERIARVLEARIDAAGADEAAARRCAGFLALPPNLPLAGRLAWESADAMWRWAGDTATDENYYSKRAILAGILTGALAVRLSAGRGAALRFMDRRLEEVMRFERWKAATPLKPEAFMTSAAAMLGRLRYGRRHDHTDPHEQARRET
jgi:ubiquinone biosynthesis protein COQ9